MTSRRRFIQIVPAVPLVGTAWLAACSDKSPPPAAAVAPPAATPSPAPAPIAAVPAPAPAAAPVAATAGGAMVDEKDPAALALGYVADSSRADSAKYKNHAAGQACANCALFGAAAGAAAGGCPLFPGRQVSAKGWCGSYTKKA